MAFDRNRPVPWKRLLKIFAIYAVVANIMLALIDRSHYGAGVILGTVMGGLFYLAFAALLAKFGWQPRSLAETRALRSQQTEARAAAKAARSPDGKSAGSADGAAARNRPAPTRRTASGVGRQRPSTKR